MSIITSWVGRNTVRLVAVVQAVIALGIEFGWWDWSDRQIAAVQAVIAAVLAVGVSGTVTANVRLGDGRMWGGLRGKTDGR